jgi:hypothetical protein
LVALLILVVVLGLIDPGAVAAFDPLTDESLEVAPTGDPEPLPLSLQAGATACVARASVLATLERPRRLVAVATAHHHVARDTRRAVAHRGPSEDDAHTAPVA